MNVATMTPENRGDRLKRMTMRASRRGIKEMDIILGNYARDRLTAMDAAGLDRFDALLSENDQDLYLWVSGQAPCPEPFGDLIALIAAHAGARPERGE